MYYGVCGETYRGRQTKKERDNETERMKKKLSEWVRKNRTRKESEMVTMGKRKQKVGVTRGESGGVGGGGKGGGAKVR